MAGRWQSGLALIDEAAAAAVLGPARAAGRERHLLQHDRGLSERRRPRAGRPVGRRGRALDAPPIGRRLSRASAGSIAPSSRCSAASGPRPSRRRARRATELERFRLLDAVGFAQYQVGEVRLRMGDLDAAAEAFDRAYEYGHDAQPGLALLQLARGEVDEARAVDRSGAGDRHGRHRRRRRPGDPRPPAAGPGRHRPRRQRPRDAPAGGRGARVDRRRLRATAVPGGRADGPRRAAARARTRPRRRRRSWASRGGCGRTTNLPYESARARLRYAEALAAEGDAATARRDLLRRPHRVRAARRDARPGAGRCAARRGAAGEPAPAAVAQASG